MILMFVDLTAAECWLTRTRRIVPGNNPQAGQDTTAAKSRSCVTRSLSGAAWNPQRIYAVR